MVTGRRPHRRDEIRMSATEVTEFLQLPHTMTVSTLGPNGAIHSVAVFYGMVDEKVAFLTKQRSQKVRNLQRDDRITCLAADGFRYEELRGVEVVGRAQLLDDPDVTWTLAVQTWHRYKASYAEFDEDDLRMRVRNRVAVVVHADTVVSWDHHKLTDHTVSTPR